MGNFKYFPVMSACYFIMRKWKSAEEIVIVEVETWGMI